ncbi:MAG: hypothetical protein JJU12_05000 [Chlamydiales bacterium]|nr:hypothetical protein [Chlamydiales bacterium]
MKIAGIVIFVHALILAGLLYLHPPQPKLKPHKPVAVQTYVIQEEKPKVVEASKPLVAAPLAPKPKPIEKPKPAPPKPKPKPAPAEKPNAHREELVRMMRESLASLEDKPAQTKKVAEVKQVGPLASETLKFEADYQDRLVAFLQNALMLPEKGDVKLALTVNRAGNVKEVKVKQAASERNQKYVEEGVPALLLPPFGSHFKGEKAHTFSITLTSS